MWSLCRVRLTWILVLSVSFAPMPLLARDFPDFADLVRRHEAEVVNISTTYAARRAEATNKDDAGSGEPRAAPPMMDGSSLGSGVIVSSDGYIITCAHVVEGASEIVVRLSDRREYRARLVGADRRSDIALLKINATNLRQASIGDPARLAVGDWVLAIGAPFGFESSATSGIVSAKSRNLPSENYVPFLQTDVAINPGNSGGPLFNLKGEVIAINSQIYSRTGTFMGVSFAIPIDIAIQIAEQIKRDGAVRRGWLGVRLQEVTHGLALAYGLDRPRGALVSDILANGPAARSDLKSGDIILEYEGRPIRLSSELPPLVGLTPPGKPARLKVFRRDKGVLDLLVKVNELREEPVVSRAASRVPVANGNSELGLVLSELPASIRKRYEIPGGVSVDDVLDGPGREAGLRIGDIIAEVDGRAVTGVANFYRAVSQSRPGQPLVLRVRRGASAVYVALTP
jgi:serine protease Do